jgi:hypothetical protein
VEQVYGHQACIDQPKPISSLMTDMPILPA